MEMINFAGAFYQFPTSYDVVNIVKRHNEQDGLQIESANVEPLGEFILVLSDIYNW